MFCVTINKSPPLWKSQLPSQFTIVTTDSPKVPGRRWYSSLFSSRDSLHSSNKTMKCNFFLLTFYHQVALAGCPQNVCVGLLHQLLQTRLPSPLSHRPSTTTKRRKMAACSGRSAWRRYRAWPLGPVRRCGCAPPPPAASAPAGWGSFHPSAPGSGSTPADTKKGRNMKIPRSVREQRRDGACILVYLLWSNYLGCSSGRKERWGRWSMTIELGGVWEIRLRWMGTKLRSKRAKGANDRKVEQSNEEGEQRGGK